jgi:hypothetical protein
MTNPTPTSFFSFILRLCGWQKKRLNAAFAGQVVELFQSDVDL